MNEKESKSSNNEDYIVDNTSNTEEKEVENFSQDQNIEVVKSTNEEQGNENTFHIDGANDIPIYSYEWESTVDNNKYPKKQKNVGLKVVAAVMTFTTLISVMLLCVVLSKQSDKVDFGNSSVNDNEGQSAVEDNKDVSYAEVIKTQTPTNDELSLVDLYEKVSGSCCSIICEVTVGSGWSQVTGTSLGSGFVITEDGYIVTNHHVIENANKITVVFYDNTSYEAKLVGSDSICDIAVLKIEGDFVPVEIGDSDITKVGQFVCAIGTPSAIQYAGTLTYGCISAINRDVKVSNSSGTATKTMNLIQTDATLNPGNSGGPLFNMYGQVIGINTLKLSSKYEGIGFSIPMTGATDIINQIIDFGYVVENDGTISVGTPYLGISTSNISSEEAEHYKVPVGVLVYQIEPNSSAYKAGLRRADIIVEFDGKNIEKDSDIKNILSERKPGQQVTVKVYRDGTNGGEYFDISFKLDTRPD